MMSKIFDQTQRLFLHVVVYILDNGEYTNGKASVNLKPLSDDLRDRLSKMKK